MFAPEVEAALEQLTEKIADLSPEARDLIEQMQRGELSEVDAITALMDVMKDPEMSAKVQSFAMAAFQHTRGPDELATAEDLLIMPSPLGDKGLPKLNPMLESALAERAQFDGDVPELRHGPMPADAIPAVPVDTTARNPVAIGQMLQQASDEVKKELDTNREDALGQGLNVAEAGAQKSSRIGTTDEEIVFHEDGRVESTVRPLGVLSPEEQIMAVVDATIMRSEPEGYKTGQLPAHRQVETPTGSALAALSPEERRLSAWKFLSTTQGRRSALKILSDLVATGLRSEGHEVEVIANQRPARVDHVPVYTEWTVSIGGQESTQPSFNFIDVAAKVLTQKLSAALAIAEPIDDPVLEIIPINTVDVRKVGWAARVVPNGS